MKLLDRYILQRFFAYLIFALLASVVIFITVDSTEHLDKFIDAKVPYHLVLKYYYLYLPYIVYLTLPVSVLLATLFTIGGFVYRNELTAMQSAGYSLWRILNMLLIIAIPLSAATLVFGESIVPAANNERKILYLEQVKKQRNPASSRKGRLYIQVGPNEYLKMEGYDPENRIGERISLHMLNDGRLKRRVTADRMTYMNDAWILENVHQFDFSKSEMAVTESDTIIRGDFTITPDDLKRVNIAPEEMNYLELRDMVTRLKASGVRAGKWVVDLAFKISQPFATVIIVLFGVPFAAFRRRGGLVFGFGLSLLVCFIYFGFMQVGKILGYNGTIEPIVAAWMGNIVFGVLGMTLVVRVPK
ncbi:MAG: LPS export ABC transporter permease LptG [Calditrichota bacterium]